MNFKKLQIEDDYLTSSNGFIPCDTKYFVKTKSFTGFKFQEKIPVEILPEEITGEIQGGIPKKTGGIPKKISEGVRGAIDERIFKGVFEIRIPERIWRNHKKNRKDALTDAWKKSMVEFWEIFLKEKPERINEEIERDISEGKLERIQEISSKKILNSASRNLERYIKYSRNQR